jgi:hypothetical protein
MGVPLRFENRTGDVRLLTTAVAALLCAPLALATAQESNEAATIAGTAARPAIALAVRAQPESPKLDGRLDEAAWQAAPVFSDFTQLDPNEAEPATERTEIRVLYTDAALYVGVRAWDSQADQIAARLTRRDEYSPSDWIIVAIDSYHDRRTGFIFWVNPAGVKRDSYIFDDGNEDDTWDAVWDVACTVDPEGWTAEFRIPFSQLRFSKADENTFGFQVIRMVARNNEESHWRLMPKEESGVVSQFGELSGIRGIKPPRRAELLPYAAATGEWAEAEEGNPFETGRDRTMRAGLDFNVGVTSNLTLSGTVNPDFGQVEADPAVVNLSAFETFYPEQRPFFNEGLDIFRFPILLGDGDGANEQLFYTRRIGRRPQGEADDRGGYAQPVDWTTILFAGKLSGKANGWTMGVLEALTAEEEAAVVDADGNPHSDVVEPRTNYLIARLARDFRNGESQVGFFGTAVNRKLPDNLQWLRSDAYSGGFDWSHRWRNDTYSVNGWIVGSHVRGSAEAIDETQLSSARYFQRPDNDYVTYDPARTSLTGFAGQFTIGKHGGGNWRFSTGVDTRTPGFEVNDAGFQREADRTIQYIWVQRRWLEPGKVIRQAWLNFNQSSVWDWGWNRLRISGNVNGSAQFANYWHGYAGLWVGSEGWSNTALRGGPAFLTPPAQNGWAGFSTDDRKSLRIGLNTSGFRQPQADVWAYDFQVPITWQAASNVSLVLAPGVSRMYDTWQYLDTQDALGETHYVFGMLDQTTVSARVRANLTFRPNLSLQIYAEPFVSSGNYVGYREVDDPRADAFADRFYDYTDDQVTMQDGEVLIDLDGSGSADLVLEDPNFTYLSFRSNVVLRWEYMSGSTLFVVWQHGRSDVTDSGQFQPGQGIQDMFRLPAVNTFVIKLNYWLSL